ncbi:hypothetical protein AM1_C0235 (plasmid) [Acaryochloris marina MBIC11017]|uniref:Uncharacterized protein n=1 Tax=Acaryochloris marina (strain MBIC 11017) TaxID=329726 RepID=A8ZMW9_ACAM1|nr:hypothetical protein AM1_C0235 [Acaryochloris marina MBIC11017]
MQSLATEFDDFKIGAELFQLDLVPLSIQEHGCPTSRIDVASLEMARLSFLSHTLLMHNQI